MPFFVCHAQKEEREVEKLFEQLSVYEVLNNFLPGAFFCILFRWQTGVGYEVNDTVTEILVFYFAGMIISRFGSLVLEPLCGKLRFVEKEAYGDYIKASKRDPKIETLSMKNNMYRTFAAAVILCGIAWAVQCIAEKSAVPRAVTIAGGWIALLVLLLAAYRKQNDYIRERIRACNKKEEKEEE